jgi:hypothetical protein
LAGFAMKRKMMKQDRHVGWNKTIEKSEHSNIRKNSHF